MNAGIKSAGFTLLELIITVSIIAIVSTLVAQSWAQLASRTKHQTLVNTYRSAFTFARSTAIQQHQRITLCPLSSAMTCMDSWNQPISVFPDNDNDKKPDNQVVYRTIDATAPGSHVYSRTAGRGYFQFTPDGMARGSMGSLVACSNSTEQRRNMSYMSVNIGGRFRVAKDEDQDGFITLPWGAEVGCED